MIAVKPVFLFNTSICADSGVTDLIWTGCYLNINCIALKLLFLALSLHLNTIVKLWGLSLPYQW